MLESPARKYLAPAAPPRSERRWPGVCLTEAPIWLSTDLRDGNQALFEPMDVERKLVFFQLLVGLGFKQIEVAFPSASQTDFAFTRRLIEERLIPDDVTIMVMTPAREPLIRRTFEALRGCPRAIVSLFNATAPVWRRDVYGLTRDEVLRMAVDHARLTARLAEDHPATQWTLQYSPEAFSATELPFAAEVCNAVVDVARRSLPGPVIINLPATVEISTPNVFADQVEWMNDHLEQRDQVILSVHPHNDRGTAVATAELALMAGAQRVEGCLLGNGERSGNVDLVTLALNLYTHGISPGLDFSRLDHVVRVVQACSGITVHPRHPYAGELVYTAFSGSHQDAIRKGLHVREQQVREGDDTWRVPYLPIDPADLGRHYESVIRVNSQSGKGGIAHVLEASHGLKLPRAMLIAFSRVVQQVVELSGAEITPDELWQLWLDTYASRARPALRLAARSAEAALDDIGQALGRPLAMTHAERQTLSVSGQPRCVAIVELLDEATLTRQWGAALHADPDTALLHAVLGTAGHWSQAETRGRDVLQA